jgi:DNA polymerase-1
VEERTSTHRLITDPKELPRIAKALESAEAVGLDTETTGLNPRDGRMRLLQIATPEETFVIDVFQVEDISALKDVLEGGPVKALHNAKFDYQFLLAEHGVRLSPVFDTMLAAQLLDGGEQGPSYALEAVAERYLDEAVDKTARRDDWSGELSERQIAYAARDAEVLLPLREKLAEALAGEELELVSRIEFGAVAALAEMELAGIKLDVEKWAKLKEVIRGRRDKAAERLESFFPEPEGVLPLEGLGPRLNLNSPQQILEAFRKIGIELPDTKVWTLLKVDHPAARALLQYRELQKKLGTYLETYPNFIHPKTGRIHANFLQCRVPTGRLACTNPNVQQIPHEDEFRSCFVAEQGNVLVITDYSQIELRILAEVSEDPAFVTAFQRGDDLHTLTAATMYGVPMEEVTRDQRSDAKRINFGLMYGRGARSLSAQLGTDEERGRQLIDEYFANYPKVQRFLQRTANRAARDRTLRTLAGRVRKFGNGAVSDDRGAMRREAMNYPIQGCVLGDTRIFEKTLGYREIQDLAGRELCVWDGEKFVDAAVIPSGPKRLVKVTLSGGHTVRCSPDHKFLTVNNLGNEHWVRAEDLRSEHRVKLADAVGSWSTKRVLPQPVRPEAHNGKLVSLGDVTDDTRLGEWIGRLASDGTLSEAQVTLLVAEHEEEILPRLLETSRMLGHVSQMTREATGNQRQRLHRLTISSRSLATQLRDMGVKGHIPQAVWSDDTLLAGYLRGLFDGDGTVNHDNAVLTFGRGAKHEVWAREVQEALLLLDIQSRVRVYPQDRAVVQVLKRDMPRFARTVGFLNPLKQSRAEKVEGTHPWKSRRGVIYGVAQKVRSVEVTDLMVPMYDVVNSESRRFAANGVVTHNTSADIAKLALFYVHEELKDLDARLINSIHDEFVVECAEVLSEEVSGRMKKAMVRAGEKLLKKVPVEVEVAVSREWRK